MIGVFDSGYGGLTILEALARSLPSHEFVFYGDHKNSPYGVKSCDQIYNLTACGIKNLFSLGCRLVVLACNTSVSSCLGQLDLEFIPQGYPQHKIFDVVLPTVEAITESLWLTGSDCIQRIVQAKKIAIFASVPTVQSDIFSIEIKQRKPQLQVFQQECPQLVSLIEAYSSRTKITECVQYYCDQLMMRIGSNNPDVVVLACTHYELVSDIFRKMFPLDVEIISQPNVVAMSLKSYLARHSDISSCEDPLRVKFYTSGNPDDVSRMATFLLGRECSFTKMATLES